MCFPLPIGFFMCHQAFPLHPSPFVERHLRVPETPQSNMSHPKGSSDCIPSCKQVKSQSQQKMVEIQTIPDQKCFLLVKFSSCWKDFPHLIGGRIKPFPGKNATVAPAELRTMHRQCWNVARLAKIHWHVDFCIFFVKNWMQKTPKEKTSHFEKSTCNVNNDISFGSMVTIKKKTTKQTRQQITWKIDSLAWPQEWQKKFPKFLEKRRREKAPLSYQLGVWVSTQK